MFIVLWRNKKNLYVEEGKATEKQKEVEFELGGLYAQCKFEREREQILLNDCYCFLEIISDVVCIFFPLLTIQRLFNGMIVLFLTFVCSFFHLPPPPLCR